jgi:hypothetical protein
MYSVELNLKLEAPKRQSWSQDMGRGTWDLGSWKLDLVGDLAGTVQYQDRTVGIGMAVARLVTWKDPRCSSARGESGDGKTGTGTGTGTGQVARDNTGREEG